MTTCKPLYSTASNPSRKTMLPVARKVARLLGYNLMPFQESVISLFTEMEDNNFVYRDCALLCPRQQGKTLMSGILLIMRCIANPNTHTFYGAQSGKDGRAMLLDEWVPLLNNSALQGSFTVRQTNGSERVLFANGSTINLLSNTLASGHGKQVDLALLDECWSFQNSHLENAVKPAMVTRYNPPGPQLILCSTAGTPDSSPYLLAKVETGRQCVADGVTEGIAYVEYGAKEGSPIDDPATWAAASPVLGITITEQAIRDELRTMDVVDLQRSRLNQWTSSLSDPIVPLAVWNGLTDRFSTPGSDLILGFDSNPDGSRSSICIASKRTDGKHHIELVVNEDGTGWLAARINQLVRDHSPRYVVCDSKSPASIVIPDLVGCNVRQLNAVEATKHYAGFVAACMEAQLVHRDDPKLTTALTAAVRRPLGDAWAFSRRNSSCDISPICAASMALYIVQSEGQGIGVWSIREVLADREREDVVGIPIGQYVKDTLGE